jgi:hypothetical protein
MEAVQLDAVDDTGQVSCDSKAQFRFPAVGGLGEATAA